MASVGTFRPVNLEAVFGPRSVHVESVVNKLAIGQVCL